MQLLDFIQVRLAFAGFPYGELRQACQEAVSQGQWQRVFLARARSWRKLAVRAQNGGNMVSAAQFWRWAACAYHAASFSFHLKTPGRGWQTQISRFRMAARGCYVNSLGLASREIVPVALNCNSIHVRAYLRKPQRISGGAVVLVNGLDSISEVELHMFGNWMVERGLAVLAVDLPAGLRQAAGPNGSAHKEVDAAGNAAADWLAMHLGIHKIGAFGVSFGGNIVARLLAGGRYTAGVAVSPPAFLGGRELSLERLRRMLGWSFAVDDVQMEKTAASFSLSTLPAPAGKILLCEMDSDELFGPEHSKTFQAWGGERVQTAHFPGEHVGTSTFHLWLPTACDWLKTALLEGGMA
jgi:pimeloyl-ACP methyl ester carboxylesterase